MLETVYKKHPHIEDNAFANVSKYVVHKTSKHKTTLYSYPRNEKNNTPTPEWLKQKTEAQQHQIPNIW